MVRSGSASAVERTRIVGMDAEARGKSGEACPLVVPGALPGEAVEVVVEHSGKTARFARLLKVLEASPERTTPQCRHFLNCGGCDLLHASLPLQHHHKRQQVALELGLPLFDVAEVVPSPQAFEYRTVAKMVVGPGVLGSYRPRSHDVVDMSGCRIHSATVELVLSTARAHLLAEGPGDLRYLVVREDDRRRALVLIITRALGSSAADALASVLAQLPQVAEIRVQENQSPGDGIFSDGPERRVYGEAGAAVGAFSQVNPGAAAELYRVATELLAPAGREVLELYAGSGGLSRVLLEAGAARVEAVEVVAPAVEVAQAWAQTSPYADRFRITLGRAEEVPLPAMNYVVVNPPRKGLGPVAERLAALPIERLVYVSCNPGTLGRDLQVILQLRPDLELDSVVPVDLFPQTRHIETVVRLVRRSDVASRSSTA
ncbi:MAG: class I SAM-dependent RNA methyltransferase [Deltaproteobacteria bacterium]|jgi:23S rRNA (uracil1939-C5)-methyltransferase|nr:class I SAM-dependent RNA methyltransferase [Deltaproteobacteria bacterium]